MDKRLPVSPNEAVRKRGWATRRAAHVVGVWQGLKNGWVWRVLVATYSVFGTAAAIVEKLPPDLRAKWNKLWVVPSLVPDWPLLIWVAVGVGILAIAVVEGSYQHARVVADSRRPDDEALALYRFNDPRLVIEEVRQHALVPYRIEISAAVENPGEATVFRGWALTVTRGNGEKLVVHRQGSDAWVCRSHEPTADGRGTTLDHYRTPLRNGGVANASLHFDFSVPLLELRLDGATRFSLQCRTIKNIPVRSEDIVCAPSGPRYEWPLDEWQVLDRALRLTPDQQRTTEDRLVSARVLFEELVAAGATGNKDAREHIFHVGHHLLVLSRHHHGNSSQYVQDFENYRAGCVRGGIRRDGYDGDG